MEKVKKLKRGEVLFKEGEAPSAVYMIQGGKVGLMVEKAKGLEVAALGVNQVIGEHALFTSAKHEYTAQAIQESRVLEVPVELMKAQFEKCPPGIKLLLKSLVDDMRQARKFMKTVKMETEKSPCPHGIIHKLFTEVHLIARHIGKKNPDNAEIMVAWDAMKLYATRFFGESPQRLRGLMDLLLKLKMVDFKVRLTEEQEEELTDVRFLQIQLMEDFAEFYQYYLFKGGKAEAIIVDPLALKVAKAFAEVSEGAEVDHRGASRVDWGKVLNECKTKYKIDLKNTHLDALERKGLFVKRQSFDDGRVEVSFDRNEFVRMGQFWAILWEIDKWNDRGAVVMVEKEETTNEGEGACPACQGKVDASNKFCPHCGHKIAAAA